MPVIVHAPLLTDEPRRAACVANMNQPMPETPPAPNATTHDAAVEAARYALLRRLAPALRHDAVAHLQPLSMIGSVLERRLAAPMPDLAQVADGVRRLMASSRGAVQSCLDIITWLAPEPGRTIALDEGVAEVVQLVRGGLAFQGFSLRNEVGALGIHVARAGLRLVLPASLLWLTDSAGPPAEVTIRAQAMPDGVQLRLELLPADGPEGIEAGPAWRPLRREEVQALARAEDIGWAQEGDCIRLNLPRAPAPAAGTQGLTPA